MLSNLHPADADMISNIKDGINIWENIKFKDVKDAFPGSTSNWKVEKKFKPREVRMDQVTTIPRKKEQEVPEVVIVPDPIDMSDPALLVGVDMSDLLEESVEIAPKVKKAGRPSASKSKPKAKTVIAKKGKKTK